MLVIIHNPNGLWVKAIVTLECCLSIDNSTSVFLGVIQLIWMLNKMRSKDSLSSEKEKCLFVSGLFHSSLKDKRRGDKRNGAGQESASKSVH